MVFGFLLKKNKDPKFELLKTLGPYQLPSFPGVVMQTLERIRDPKATPSKVAEVMAADPGLSVKILRTVNSAAYSLANKVKSLDQAIALLGISQVESLVLSMAVGAALPRPTAPGFDATRFWRAAARRAATARALAARLHPARGAESFTAALLQDMAVPILAEKHPARYGPLLEHWHNSDEDLAALETKEFGWNHPEVATWICDEWKLPESLAAAIGGHHGVHSPGNEGLAAPPAVTLVSHVRELDDRNGVEALVEAAAAHGLKRDDAAAIVDESFKNAEELAKLFA